MTRKRVVCEVYGGGQRRVAADSLVFRPSSYVVIIHDNRLLVNCLPTGELWLPGGAVKKGESLHEAGVREVREETGLKVKLYGPPIATAETFFCFGQSAWQCYLFFFLGWLNRGQSPDSLMSIPSETEGLPQWIGCSRGSIERMKEPARSAVSQRFVEMGFR